MDVAEVPAETVISGEVANDDRVQEVLTLIQSLGLEVVAVRRASPGEFTAAVVDLLVALAWRVPVAGVRDRPACCSAGCSAVRRD
jgi:hypothetical protein